MMTWKAMERKKGTDAAACRPAASGRASASGRRVAA